MTYSKSKKRPNCRSGNNKNREDDQALVCRDEVPPKREGKENGKMEAWTNEWLVWKLKKRRGSRVKGGRVIQLPYLEVF